MREEPVVVTGAPSEYSHEQRQEAQPEGVHANSSSHDLTSHSLGPLRTKEGWIRKKASFPF